MSVIKLISTLALVIVGGFVALTTPYNDFSIAAMRDGIRNTFRDATAFVKQARINPVSVLSPKKDSVAATLPGVSDRTGQSARDREIDEVKFEVVIEEEDTENVTDAEENTVVAEPVSDAISDGTTAAAEDQTGARQIQDGSTAVAEAAATTKREEEKEIQYATVKVPYKDAELSFSFPVQDVSGVVRAARKLCEDNKATIDLDENPFCAFDIARFTLNLFKRENIPLTADAGKVEVVKVPIADSSELFDLSIDTGLSELAIADASLGFCLGNMEALGINLGSIESCAASVVEYVNGVVAKVSEQPVAAAD